MLTERLGEYTGFLMVQYNRVLGSFYGRVGSRYCKLFVRLDSEEYTREQMVCTDLVCKS